MKEYPRDMQADEIRALVGESPLMLEVGSHEGSHTVQFLKARLGIRLYCFEPDLRPIARFKQTIGNDPRVMLYKVAVADVDDCKPFYASTGKAGSRDDWDFSGSLHKPTGHLARSPEIKFKKPANVPCIRLDTWHHRINPNVEQIDFLWCAIQGAQRDFIAGGKLALAVTRYLYIEAHQVPLYDGETTQDELIALLPGFEPLGLYGGENILFENKHKL